MCDKINNMYDIFAVVIIITKKQFLGQMIRIFHINKHILVKLT